jgi:general secretion pathway protein G
MQPALVAGGVETMLLATIRRSPARRSAFTLMEVLIVVAIIVILAGGAIIAVPRILEDVKKSRAHTSAVNLAKMCEAYKINPANPTGDYPSSPQELLQPPFGGASYLTNGMEDLNTPWGQQFSLEPQQKPDGTLYMLVHTTAPDGTPVSNFGIGPKAKPSFMH